MRKKLKAIADRSVSELSATSRCMVTLDRQLMEAGDIAVGDIVKIETELGRETVGRVDEPRSEDDGSGMIRMDRFLRQAIKSKINETVTVEKIQLGAVKRVVLLPPVDVTSAHHLIEHLTKTFSANESPVMEGSVLYSSFHHSSAGTIYKVVEVHDGPGIITAETKIEVETPESRTIEGAFDTTFEDVGGLGAQIKLVRELIQLPLQFPFMYHQLGIQAPRGIILYGPPGSGKTHLARAVANELQARFYYINGPSIVGTMYGETESNLRKIFNEASHHAPSVIFIDEVDSVAPRREHLGAQSDIRAVTQLLSLMDGLSKVESVVVIGTTNRVDAVDTALRRPGRFDREVFIGPPTAEGRLEILQIHTREMPLTDQAIDYLPEVAKATHGFVGADLMELCREAGLHSLRKTAAGLSHHLDAFQIKPEQIVVESSDFQMALTKIRPSALREALVSIPDVRWEEVGGLKGVKKALEEFVLKPLSNPERYLRFGVTPPRGILLHGPSGTGKTLLAKALANAAGVNFLALDGPEVFSKWLGESEEAIRHIFQVARQLAPSIVFFDQLDAIVPKRGMDSGSRTTERVVNQMLSELDGMEVLANIVVIGATNRIDLIDSSVLRPGRLGTQIDVPMPDQEDRKDILKRLLSKVSVASAFPVEEISSELAVRTEGFSGADLQAICEEAMLQAMSLSVDGDRLQLETEHFQSVIDRIHNSRL